MHRRLAHTILQPGPTYARDCWNISTASTTEICVQGIFHMAYLTLSLVLWLGLAQCAVPPAAAAAGAVFARPQHRPLRCEAFLVPSGLLCPARAVGSKACCRRNERCCASRLRCAAIGSAGAGRWACRAVGEVDLDAVCELDRACYGEKVHNHQSSCASRKTPVDRQVATGSPERRALALLIAGTVDARHVPRRHQVRKHRRDRALQCRGRARTPSTPAGGRGQPGCGAR